jgi:hypothetical protein
VSQVIDKNCPGSESCFWLGLHDLVPEKNDTEAGTLYVDILYRCVPVSVGEGPSGLG